MKMNSPSNVPFSSSSSCRPYRKTGVEKTEQWDALPAQDPRAPQGLEAKVVEDHPLCHFPVPPPLKLPTRPKSGKLSLLCYLGQRGTLWKWSNSEELVSPPRQGGTARCRPLGSATTPRIKRYATPPSPPPATTQRNHLHRQQSPLEHWRCCLHGTLLLEPRGLS